jgi:hypothetical protein
MENAGKAVGFDLLLKINQWVRHSLLLEFVFGSGCWGGASE